jgi:hypothetical protein
MGKTLYLLQTRARKAYVCPSCTQVIPLGARHFRHDPIAQAQIFRGERITHWCYKCIMSSDPGPMDQITKRYRVPAVRVLPPPPGSMVLSQPPGDSFHADQLILPFANPLRIEVLGIGALLTTRLAQDPTLVHDLTPEQFEELICDRLFAMGFESRRTGNVNRKDGGVDILFWPRERVPFPFLCAAQVKHHADKSKKDGASTVRDFAGVMAGHPFNAGLIVTNTSFSPDAHWFSKQRAKLIRLRDFQDIRRWLFNHFADDAEWREIPDSIEIAPGVFVRIR